MQSEQELRWIVDTMARLCLIGGDRFAVRAAGSGGADLALSSLNARGNVQGEFQLERSRVEGLVAGIDNSLSALAASQASEARQCLQPLRERLLVILLPSPGAAPAPRPAPQADAPRAGPQGQALPISPPRCAATTAGAGSSAGSDAPRAVVQHDGGRQEERPSSRVEPGEPGHIGRPLAYRPGRINQNPRGFDCARAAMPMDHVICSFQEVYDINTQHAVAWWATLERLSRPEKDVLVQKQRAWIVGMLEDCKLPPKGRPTTQQASDAAPCVRDAYVDRLKFIRSYRV